MYAYSTGTYSSRRMAAKLVDDMAYRFLAAGNSPDFGTLSDFRKTHGAEDRVSLDSVAQVIVAQHATPNAPEQNELIPIVSEMMCLMGRLPEQLVADAGYWSEANAEHPAAKGIDGYLARGRMKHGECSPPPPRGRIPAMLSVAERM